MFWLSSSKYPCGTEKASADLFKAFYSNAALNILAQLFKITFRYRKPGILLIDRFFNILAGMDIER